MKILVTGTAGFIGYHFTKKMAQMNHKVVGLDNINNYYDINLKYDRLSDLGFDRNEIVAQKLIESKKQDNSWFLKADLTDSVTLENLFEQHDFTHVVHLAAQAGVRYSLENPTAYVNSNLVGFANILECCRHYSVKHLVFASSSSVYGQNKKVPFSESDAVNNPASFYAATKKSNELMAYTYSHLYGFQTTGLRFFTVYGPWGRPDMAPILFADAISKNKPIKVFNGGDMKRDFTYIDDIVKGIEQTMLYENDRTPPHEIFNIGNSKPVDLMQFIKYIEEELNMVAEKNMMPMQPGDVKMTYADTSKLEEKTGYSPSTDLKEGLRNFVKWFNKYYT